MPTNRYAPPLFIDTPRASRPPRLRQATRATLALLALLGLAAAPHPLGAQTSDTLAEAIEPLLANDVALLAAHGVADGPGPIQAFLENGFSPGKNLADPPEEPAVRSALVVSAMAVASLRRYGGALQALERLARDDLAPGLERIVDHDARAALSSVTDQRRAGIRDTLRFNAIHALGVMGDPRSAPFLKRAFDAERVLANKINLGLALAACGDGSALRFLIRTLDDDNSQAAAQAAEAVRLITGRHWALTDQSSHARKRGARREADAWLSDNRNFVPNREAVRQRRLYAPDPPRLPLPPTSLLDWIVIGTKSPELSGEYTRLNAFQQVMSSDAMAMEPLSAIIVDEMEDIDIRLFAMRAYAAIVRLEKNFASMKAPALDLLRQATRSDDDQVATMARSLRDSLRAIE